MCAHMWRGTGGRREVFGAHRLRESWNVHARRFEGLRVMRSNKCQVHDKIGRSILSVALPLLRKADVGVAAEQERLSKFLPLAEGRLSQKWSPHNRTSKEDN